MVTIGQYLKALHEAFEKAGHDAERECKFAGNNSIQLHCYVCKKEFVVGNDPELAFSFLPCDWPTGASVDYGAARLVAA